MANKILILIGIKVIAKKFSFIIFVSIKSNKFKWRPKYKYHDYLKEALIKDGWEITDDPYIIETEGLNFIVDLAAEKMIAAQKGNQKIAVEIKSFLKESTVSEFHTALGQFLNYRLSLAAYE